jgi:hypothetical protein
MHPEMRENMAVRLLNNRMSGWEAEVDLDLESASGY